MPDLVVGHVDMDEFLNNELSDTYNIKSLPTQIFVTLKGTAIVEIKKILGLDWSSFISTYGDIKATEELTTKTNETIVNT